VALLIIQLHVAQQAVAAADTMVVAVLREIIVELVVVVVDHHGQALALRLLLPQEHK
jgi:hypothetical protein